jgi:Zn-dependent peptidase ImmA (M78 family)
VRRGFKTEATGLAAEIRREICLTAYEPLDPWSLAAHLEIPVWTLSSYRDAIPCATDYLLNSEDGAFSAVLAFDGLARVIIHNDAHALTRQRADISHELAHALLLHQPHPAPTEGRVEFDLAQEEEAKWLGGVLLVPDEFCVACARRSIRVETAAEEMGVSVQLMRWRFNMSGARRRAQRASHASG